MTDLVDVCKGYGDSKGSLGDVEPFYGLSGSLMCIADGEEGDIALVELEKFVEELPKIGESISDYTIVTPLGFVKEINRDMLSNITFLKNVTFGVKAYPAIMTAFNKTGECWVGEPYIQLWNNFSCLLKVNVSHPRILYF